MAKSQPSIQAHHDPSPTHFTLTIAELEAIETCARNPAREYLLFCLGLFLPTLANFLADLNKTPLAVTPTLLLNGMVSVCTALVGVFMALTWWRSRGQLQKALSRLRDKPITTLVVTSAPTTEFVTTPSNLKEPPTSSPAGVPRNQTDRRS